MDGVFLGLAGLLLRISLGVRPQKSLRAAMPALGKPRPSLLLLGLTHSVKYFRICISKSFVRPLFFCSPFMSALHVQSEVCMAPFHVRSKVYIAPIHVRSKFADFAPHMDESYADFAPHMEGSHADFAPHIERRHSFRDQK